MRSIFHSTFTVYLDAIRTARKEATVPIKIFISKWILGQTATRVVMVRRQQRVSSECPRCGEQLEHLQHILTCTDQSAIDLFDSLLTTLEGWLTHVNTHPTLIIFLTTGLRSWHEDPQGIELSLPAFERPLHIALQSQLAIGWYALLCGLVTKHFKSIQTVYYQQLGLRNSGRRWAIRQIGKVWHITHSMGCHRSEALHESPIINSRHTVLTGYTQLYAQSFNKVSINSHPYTKDNSVITHPPSFPSPSIILNVSS